MLFAIDHGNSAINTPDFVFTSGLTDYPVKPPVETDVLEFGGTFWTLSGERIPYYAGQDQGREVLYSQPVCHRQGTSAAGGPATHGGSGAGHRTAPGAL